MVQAEYVSTEENLVIAGSYVSIEQVQLISIGPKMH